MTKQEIDFVEIIADDDFSVPGGMVRQGEPFRCTRGKAKELVAIKKAHYPTEDERKALADEKAADAEPEGDQEKLEAKRSETQAADAEPEGDQEKFEATRSETQATDAEPEGDAEKRDEIQATPEPSTGATAEEAAGATAAEATAKAETPKATKSTKASK